MQLTNAAESIEKDESRTNYSKASEHPVPHNTYHFVDNTSTSLSTANNNHLPVSKTSNTPTNSNSTNITYEHTENTNATATNNNNNNTANYEPPRRKGSLSFILNSRNSDDEEYPFV